LHKLLASSRKLVCDSGSMHKVGKVLRASASPRAVS
jgi:hypothetical protein